MNAGAFPWYLVSTYLICGRYPCAARYCVRVKCAFADLFRPIPPCTFPQITGVAGYIIGRRGGMIREIQETTGATVTVDDSTAGKEMAHISAKTKAELESAIARVNEAVKAAREAPPRAPPAFEARIEVRTMNARAGPAARAAVCVPSGCGCEKHDLDSFASASF